MNTLSPDLPLRWLALLALEFGMVVVVACLVRRLLKSAPWRRALWQMTFMGIAVITLLEFSGQSRRLLRYVTTSPSPDTRQQFSASRRAADLVEVGARAPSELSEEFRKQVAARLDPRSSHVQPIAPNESPSSSVRNAGGLVLILWGAGSLLLVIRFLVGHALFQRHRATGRVITEEALGEQLGLVREGLRVRGAVELREIRQLTSPIAFGLFRRGIGVPAGFSGRFPMAQQQVMLAHEMAHVAARDPAWQFLADLTVALWWWHPLLWLARLELFKESEAAADEASLLFAEGPHALAECLVRLGGELNSHRPCGSPGIEGFRSHLGRRVEKLLALRGGPPRTPRRVVLAATQFVGAAMVVALTLYSTAWAVPRALTEPNNNMKNITLTWKSSIASLLLVSASPLPAADTAAATKPPVGPTLPAVAAAAPNGGRVPPGAKPEEGEVKPGWASKTASGRAGRSQVQKRVQEIILREFQSDGLPLAEVIRELTMTAKKQDPAGFGVNFVINNSAPLRPAPVDPATGLPLPPQEVVDVESITVPLRLPVQNVRLSDLLDIISRITTPAVQFTYEEFGIIVSIRPPDLEGGAALTTRTFRVEPSIFFRGMEAAFGIDADPITGRVSRLAVKEPGVTPNTFGAVEGAATGQPGVTPTAAADGAALASMDNLPSQLDQQRIFRELFAQLGVKLDPPKSIFFNGLTGMVMVRVALNEIDVVQAAIETLGGQAVTSY